MKIKPVIAIILEALASFVNVISDTVFCPGGIFHEAGIREFCIYEAMRFVPHTNGTLACNIKHSGE